MRAARGNVRRRVAIVLAALLAAAGLAASARGEHSVLDLVSTGPAGGNGPFSSDLVIRRQDGSSVVLFTNESLVSDDADAEYDLYQRAGGQTKLVSTGPAGGNGAHGAGFASASDDGAHIFFVTFEKLVDGDDDGARDVYERAGGQTTLVSTGPKGNGPSSVPDFDILASSDGTRLFFESEDQLVDADADAQTDVYERAGGQTKLVSAGGNGDYFATLAGASADGSRVWFRTEEPLLGDGDGRADIYERAGGQTTLVSTGSPDDGDFEASFAGASRNGARVFFITDESLVDGDSDSVRDVYERASGQTTLISRPGNGPSMADFAGASSDGARVFFGTDESLVSGDEDSEWDVYERAGGQTALVSTGPAGGNGPLHVDFGGASSDGARVFFLTAESLVSDDEDSQWDIYERAGGQTTLVSTGPAGDDAPIGADFAGASSDGTRVFLNTFEHLVSGDTDGSQDLYERAGGRTTLLSTGPAGGNGAFDVFFEWASADGAKVFLNTAEPLMSSDKDMSNDVYLKRIPAPESTALPVISGSAVAGQALACSQGSWSNEPTRFQYGWNRDGVAIAGAASARYTVAQADVGHRISCTVTASNGGGSGAATSAPVTPVAATPGGPPPGPLPGACANSRAGTGGSDSLRGGAFGDRLRGLGGNDVLAGLEGDDCLSGGPGKDRLSGGPGKDRLDGGGGKDRLNGGPGKDRLNGGGGKDRLKGGGGKDRVDGGRGNDSIDSRDKRHETVTCGAGDNDRVRADRVDTLVGCERVARR